MEDGFSETGSGRSGEEAIRFGEGLEPGLFLSDCGFLSMLCIDLTLHHTWPLVPDTESIAPILQVDGIPYWEWLAERKHAHPFHHRCSVTRTWDRNLPSLSSQQAVVAPSI